MNSHRYGRDSGRDRDRERGGGDRWMTDTPTNTVLLRGLPASVDEKDVSRRQWTTASCVHELLVKPCQDGMFTKCVCSPQIKAELMLFGAPVKDVRLMKRKDTGENLLPLSGQHWWDGPCIQWQCIGLESSCLLCMMYVMSIG